MEFREHLENHFRDCLSCSCEKEGCSLSLVGLSPLPVIIDGDKYQKQASHRTKLCDYMVFYLPGRIVTAAVELTEGRTKENALKQIERGAFLIGQVLESRPAEFFPIHWHRRRGRGWASRALSKAKVSFQGTGYPVIVRECGTSLKQIIQENR